MSKRERERDTEREREEVRKDRERENRKLQGSAVLLRSTNLGETSPDMAAICSQQFFQGHTAVLCIPIGQIRPSQLRESIVTTV